MAGTQIRMIGDGRCSLSEIHAKIHYIEGAEQVFHQEMRLEGTDVWLLVYEKYYFRCNSYVSLTVLLTQQETRQTAQIIATGGGYGIANHSYGANRQFAQQCVQALQECGFSIDEQNSDALPKNLVERYIK